MRRFSKISGMTIVSCDWVYDQRFPGEARCCGEEFRSASVPKVIPKQLELAGWKVRTIQPGGTRQTQDLCPMHAERAGFGAHRMPERRNW
jgi:hypothetical protein